MPPEIELSDVAGRIEQILDDRLRALTTGIFAPQFTNWSDFFTHS